MNDLLIRNVRPWGGVARDIAVTNAVVSSGAPASAEVVDGGGRILLPGFSDAHVHLDSSRIGLPFRPHSTPPGPLWNQIMNDREHWRDAEASVTERATATLGSAIAHGMTSGRSYAQVDADCGLERLDGVLAAREAHRARVGLEIVAFPQAGLLLEPGVPALVEEALRQGADIVGGIDPCALDRDPRRHLDAVFEIAERHGADIDIHLHEPGELGAFSAREILRRTRALDYRGRVTIAHAFCLSELDALAAGALLDEIAELDVALTTIAPSGRAALPLAEILGRGIRIGLGQDGQRDYWSPYGNTDMLDRAWQLAFTNGLRRDDDIEQALGVATLGGVAVSRGRSAVGPDRGVGVGSPADFVLVDAETPTSAVMDRPGGRTTIRAGRVSAENGELR